MAADRLKIECEIKNGPEGENSDEAFRRVCGGQIKACEFRRWYSVVRSGRVCEEISEELNLTLKQYSEEGLTDEEAFADHCPDYVSPGEFSVLFDRHRMAGKQPETAAVIDVPY